MSDDPDSALMARLGGAIMTFSRIEVVSELLVTIADSDELRAAIQEVTDALGELSD